MKHLATIILTAVCLPCMAQINDETALAFSPYNVEKYDVKVLSDKSVATKISQQWQRQAAALTSNNRGAFFDGLFAVTKTAALTTLSQGGVAIASQAFSTITQQIKSKKDEWRKTVESENSYTKKITMLQNLDDFYSNVSDAGALDPSGMSFNGFSCLQQRGSDTVFYLSCRLDTSETAISRILRHSKFQLSLDTLVFKPSLCNLPNDNSRHFSERKPYSFDERGNISFSINFDISSSWINQAIQIYRDVKLGSFSVNVAITPENIGSDGVFRYIAATADESDNCQIIGDCFIVPRSYIGVRDSEGMYHDAWGTGQYRVEMTVKETCSVMPLLEKNWKADWKSRPKPTLKQTIALSVKETLSKNSSAWIASMTQAPIGYTKEQIIKALGIKIGNQQPQTKPQQ